MRPKTLSSNKQHLKFKSRSTVCIYLTHSFVKFHEKDINIFKLLDSGDNKNCRPDFFLLFYQNYKLCDAAKILSTFHLFFIIFLKEWYQRHEELWTRPSNQYHKKVSYKNEKLLIDHLIVKFWRESCEKIYSCIVQLGEGFIS